jgi:hypothetical protein
MDAPPASDVLSLTGRLVGVPPLTAGLAPPEPSVVTEVTVLNDALVA